jgi:hypothetical protein
VGVAEGKMEVAGTHTYSGRDRVWSVRSCVGRVRFGESLNISDQWSVTCRVPRVSKGKWDGHSRWRGS